MLSHTETLPHTLAHTHTSFYTEISEMNFIEFTPRNFAHTDAITNRGASTKEAFTR